MRIVNTSSRGFTLVEIMIVTALIGMLAVIAVPTWVRARTRSQTNTCIQNMNQISAAVQQWALETKQAAGATVTYDEIKGYLKNSLTCPAGGVEATFSDTYELHGVGANPTCVIDPVAHVLPPEN